MGKTLKWQFFHALFALLFVVLLPVLSSQAEWVVMSGQTITIMTVSSIDQACHSTGPVSVGVIEGPQGGQIEIRRTRSYPNFVSFNTRSRCNVRKLPATEIIYRASRGYTGSDAVRFEVIFPNGEAHRYRSNISVR